MPTLAESGADPTECPRSRLIADSDVARSERLARACESQGLRAQVVVNGASALEHALSVQPAALVWDRSAADRRPAHGGDPARESAHGADSRVFIANSPSQDGAAKGDTRVLPGSADPETIARFVGGILEKRRNERAHSGDADAAEAGAMQGSLGPLSAAELLELFHMNLQTGSLELVRGRGRGRQRGSIGLREGQVVQAQVGAVLGEKAFLRLIGWERGPLSFRPGAPAETNIDRPTRALLREGLRQRGSGSASPPSCARAVPTPGCASRARRYRRSCTR